MFEILVSERRGFFKTEDAKYIFNQNEFVLGELVCRYEDVLRVLITGSATLEMDISFSDTSFSAKLLPNTLDKKQLAELRSHFGDRLIIR